MNQYEVNFIIDPVLSGDEIKSTAKTYENLLVEQGATIVHVNEMGLKQLAYPINKKSSGIYYCIEFTSVNGSLLTKTELAMRRDERLLRFLTIRLDKYGIQYNADRRAGVISPYKKKDAKKKPGEGDDEPVRREASARPAYAKPAPAKPAPVVEPVAPPVPVVAANEEE